MGETAGLMANTENDSEAGGQPKGWDRLRKQPSALDKLLSSPLARESLSWEGPGAHSFIRYDATQWLPTMLAALKGVDSFVLTPCALLFCFNVVLTLAARAAVRDEDHLSGHQWSKHAPAWVSLPPFAHTVLGGALSFIMVFRTNTAYSRWWEARLMWGQIVLSLRAAWRRSRRRCSSPTRGAR